jgi:3-hydroxyisobutyrate dehydrogenase-like beta-hydroxyacid dehydrogenase
LLAESQSRATVCKTAAEITKHADITFAMLPDTPDVEKVLQGLDFAHQGKTPVSTGISSQKWLEMPVDTGVW